MKKERKHWFKARQQGSGWLPSSWQGWLTVFVWLLVVTGVISWLNLIFENVWVAMALSILWCSFMLGALAMIARAKSDKPAQTESSQS